ncbi:MAG: tetraacyldisaccharide 4'-kinase [Deltaproteobacteria bacterium]|nr:tetraacyldisaccharide 4'-kinase [Deltaproteobacteria bacterium]
MKKLNNWLRRIWYTNGTHSVLNPVIPMLRFLSFLYRSTVGLRNRLYDLGIIKQERLPCKVISIGNITVGGTGKTPMVIMLANFLKEKGYRPAVLSRGYGGKAKSPVNIVSDGAHTLMGHVEAGDEPVLIAKSTEGIPVLTGPKRTLTGRIAIENLGADILILDDAFQHRRIFRDVDIVLLNRGKPFGNGFLLPGGPLREPPEALKRADFIIWKDSSLDGRYPKFQEQGIDKFLPVLSGYLKPKAVVRGNAGEVVPVEYIKGKKICAFAGIGSPETLAETIESIGGVVVSSLPFPDHCRYTSTNISDIQKKASATGAEIIMTTEKDGIRLTDFPDFLKDIFVLRVEMEMLPSRDAFEEMMLEELKKA